jgi:integrase
MRLGRNKRSRKHDSDEIRAYFAACDAMDHPMDEFLRAMLLTGQRKNEVRLAEWSEIDMVNKVWTIPAVRFKTGKSQPVPLSVPMVQLLDRIRAKQGERRGPFIFSLTDGLTPMAFNSFDMDHFRAKLSEIYLENNPQRPPPAHWTLHDDRRTVRTALSNLGVPYEVAEAVIGHNKEALEETYNRNSFKIQRRRALHMWAEEVKFILDDPTHSLEAEENTLPEWPSRWNETDPTRPEK